jgi:hypothetical protein
LLLFVCQLLDITQQIPIRHPFGLKNSAEILHPTEEQTIFMGLYAQRHLSLNLIKLHTGPQCSKTEV